MALGRDGGRISVPSPAPSTRKPPVALIAWTALTLVALALGAGLAFAWIANARMAETRAQLEAVLDASHQALRTWSRDQMSTAETWAASPDVTRLAEDLLRTPARRDALLASPAQHSLRTLLAPVMKSHRYDGFFVIGPGNISLSSAHANIGTESPLLAQSEVLERLWAGDAALSLPQESEIPTLDASGRERLGAGTMFVGAPIRDASGRVIALLTFRIAPWRDFTETLQHGRIGESGESYSFDSRGRMISESRFDDQLRQIGLVAPGERGSLNIEVRDPGVNLVDGETSEVARGRQPLTLMAASAVSGESGFNVDGYRDYRGVEVVGAWLWDSDLGFGLTTEIDAHEAYGTLRTTQYVGVAMTGFAMLLVVGLALVFNRSRRQAVELQEKLAKVLSGYIPICAGCKMIKDEDGGWMPVESYVSQRTEAMFSHSICPKCGKELYGDLYPGENEGDE